MRPTARHNRKRREGSRVRKVKVAVAGRNNTRVREGWTLDEREQRNRHVFRAHVMRIYIPIGRWHRARTAGPLYARCTHIYRAGRAA